MTYNFTQGLAYIKELDKITEKRIAEILATEGGVEVSGNRYYMSNDGDDENDGRSPERAWRTIWKLRCETEKLCEGDGVYFRRGDTFRGSFETAQGVTYTAYGVGAKPRLLASPRDYASPELWRLYDAEKGIWRLCDDVRDVGGVFFDGGRLWGRKVRTSFYEGKYWKAGSENTVPFDISSELSDEYDFVSLVYGDKKDSLGVDVGELYIKCSKGNPGEVFENIELNVKTNLIGNRNHHNVRIDNLCLAHCGSHGVGSGTTKNLTVTNCEVAFIGGAVQYYNKNNGNMVRFGNGIEIYGGCDGYTVDNCYIHDCYDAGITHQFHSPMSNAMYNIKYTNNVILDCAYSVEYFNSDRNPPEGVVYDGKNYEISGNIMRRAGNSWGRPCDKASSHLKGWTSENKYADRSFTVKGNVFDRAYGYMIQTPALEEDWLPVFTDNVYIQTPDGMLGYYDSYTEIYPFDENVDKIIGEKLGDKTARIYFVPEQKI